MAQRKTLERLTSHDKQLSVWAILVKVERKLYYPISEDIDIVVELDVHRRSSLCIIITGVLQANAGPPLSIV